MNRLITDKDLLKDTMQSLAYFVLISGFARLTFSPNIELSVTQTLVFLCVFLAATLLAFSFSIFHVAGKLIKLYIPSFEVPIIEKQYNLKSLSALLKDKGLMLWLLLGFPYAFIGMDIVKIGFHSINF